MNQKRIHIGCHRLDTEGLQNLYSQAQDGGIVAFTGTVRNATSEREVLHLDFEAYEPMAVHTLEQLRGKTVTDLKRIEQLGLEHLPVCMAKTQKSFSDDDKKLARPTGFTVTVREFEFASGAGFLIPILGKMMRMPGLPAVPASEGMDIDNNGTITGLS